jgi:hypothetical protein
MVLRYSDQVRRTAEALRAAGERLWAGKYSPPPSVSAIGRLLWNEPKPLIDPRHRFIVIFSAKSACTNVLIWFLTQIGHHRAARDFHRWPHRYRMDVYYDSKLYRDALSRDFDDFKVIRVVRDPFERASSFRHAVGFDFADRSINWRIGRRNMERDGLSFSEFLSFLERLNLQNCDPHFAIQRHPLEDRLKPDYLINVSRENLFDRLNEIEAELNLKRTSLRDDSWVRKLRYRDQPTLALENCEAIYTRRLTRQAARNGPWPRSDALLTDDARRRIGALYAKDIACYL